MALVITTNGNGVEIADGSSAPVNFVNAVYRWYFHNGVLRLTAGPCEFFAAVGSVTVDGDTPNNETDLNTALGAVFPQSGGGGGGIDDVLSVGQALAAERTIDLNGNDLRLQGGNLKLLNGGFSSDNGTTVFGITGTNGSAPTPDSTINIVINGQVYFIAAQIGPQ